MKTMSTDSAEVLFSQRLSLSNQFLNRGGIRDLTVFKIIVFYLKTRTFHMFWSFFFSKNRKSVLPRSLYRPCKESLVLLILGAIQPFGSYVHHRLKRKPIPLCEIERNGRGVRGGYSCWLAKTAVSLKLFIALYLLITRSFLAFWS